MMVSYRRAVVVARLSQLKKSVKRVAHDAVTWSAIAGIAALGTPLQAATTEWTAASGTNLNWSDAANWTVGAPTAADDVVLPTPVPNPGALLGPQVLALSSGDAANSLLFADGYSLAGGSLAITSGEVRVLFGARATIHSQLTGDGGLWKRGDGSLRLGNAANDYTGATQIDAGVVSVLSQGALGADSSPVVVSGNQLRGSGGGQLVIGSLDNNLTGLTWSRDLQLTGGGPTGDSNALISVGNNIFTGSITTGGHPAGRHPIGGVTPTASGTTLASTFGLAQVTGSVTLGPSGQTTTFTGNGNWLVSGNIDGAGNLSKTGAGSLHLTGVNTFTGIVYLNGGFLRVDNGAALGQSTSTSGMDMQSGTLEIRTDTFGFDDRKLRVDNGGTLFVDHAPGSTLQNQSVVFQQLTIDATETLVLTSRNGYGVTFSANMSNSNLSGDNTFTLNGNGLTTFGGNFWSTTNSSNRTMTLNGNGDSLIVGGVRGSNGEHNLTKRGSGTLTILGVNSNYGGATNIEGGTLAITDFRSINNNSAVIKIGANGLTGVNTGLAGTLEIIGDNLLQANVTTDKVVTLGGTTNGATILANQTGTSPGLTFNADFAVGADGEKTLTLGGSNALDNSILGAIPDSGGGATSLTKIGDGTWLLAGTNTYTGATTLVEGTLKLRANGAASTVLSEASAIVFGTLDGEAGGGLEFVGIDGENDVEQLGALQVAAGAATIRLTPGIGGTATLEFASAATPAAGGGLNVVAPSGGGVSIGGLPTGFWDARTTWNGTDFVFSDGGVLRAPIYDVDAGFVTAGTALVSGAHNAVLAATSSEATTIGSLKIVGSQAVEQTGLLTINGGPDTAGGILQIGGSGAITGVGVTTAGAGDLVVRVDAVTDVLTLSAPIESSTMGGLTKNGAGTLVLGGINAQTGPTTVNQGTLVLAPGSQLSADSQALDLRGRGTLDLNGQTTGTGGSTSSIGAFNGTGIVTNNAVDAATLVVGGGNGTGTFLGTIQDGVGQVNVTKLGSGAQTWGGLSTYTGVTTLLSTGKVTLTTLADIGQASGIGAGDATSDATNAASLVFGGASNSSPAGLVYTGRASVSTNRLFTISGTATNGGASLIANGFNHASVVFSNTGAIVYAEGATGTKNLNLDGSSQGDNRINLQLIDNTNDGSALGVFKNGTGLWVLGNGANTYSGLTRLNRGTLRAYDGASLSPNSNLFFASTGSNTTVLETSGEFSRALGNGAGEVRWSAAANGGFAAAESKLTVNIGGGSALSWGTGSFVSTTLVLNSTTALAEVEFANSIDLNGDARTIRVDDNSTTGSDFATISGVITGAAGSGLTKIGGGILQLLAANTFSGDVRTSGGALRVVHIGNQLSVASNFGIGSNVLTVGSGGSTSTFTYLGDGETTDRLIEIGGSSGSIIFEASGSGPLVLTNVINASAGTSTKTFYLRGDSNDANEITSVLADNSAGGNMNLTKDDNGTWILSGANTYSGNTTVSVGALGLGVDSTSSGGVVTSGPVGTGLFIISNGTLFGVGGDRTIDNLMRLNGATSLNVIGSYSLTFNGGISIGATTSSTIPQVTNSLPQGKTLTITSPTFTGPDTATRNIRFNGGGDTILNAAVTDSTSGGVVNLIYDGFGSLTLGGSNGPSTYSGTTTLSSGTLRIGVDEALPSGAGKSDLTISPAEGLTATLDLNGHVQTINGLSAVTAGFSVIDNSAATPAELIFGAENAAVDFFGAVANSGAGALALTKVGTGAASFSQGPFVHRGATTVAGGTLTLAADVGGTSSLNVLGDGSWLSLTGGLSGAAGITTVTVEAGATLSLLDGAGSKLLNLTSLNLGAVGSGTTTLRLNVGDLDTPGDELQTDLLRLLNGGSLALGNTITFNLSDAGLNPGTTYTLLEALDGGLLGGPLVEADYILGNAPGGFTSMTLNVTDNLVQLTTGALVTGDLYWTGAIDTTWNAGLANWSSTKGGAPADSLPGAGTNVVFQADTLTGGAAVATTLEQNFRVNGLRFEASTNPADTPASVTIDSGSEPNYRLQIAPQTPTEGILLAAGGPLSVAINAPLKLGASQTWTVADAAATLSIGGPLSGSGALVKAGAGTALLNVAAEGTLALTSVTVAEGTLALADADALGSVALGTAAPLQIDAGGLFYFSNATNAEFGNAITLNGGTLAGAGANHTFSGPLTITADSTLSTRDAGTVLDTPRTIVISGEISGPGRLTLNGNPELVRENSVTGTVVLMQANPNWTGGVLIDEGTFDVRNEQALGTGSAIIRTGRMLFKGATNSVWNLLPGGLTIDDTTGNAVGEFHADSQGTAGQFTANIVGDVVLGGGGAAPFLRLYQTDVLSNFEISGDVLLGADAVIHSVGAATAYTGQDNVISGVISDAGLNFGLNVNSDAAFAQSRYQVLRLDGANTFTGGVFVRAGVLAFSTVSDNGGGPSNLGQGSDGLSLQGGILRFVGDADQTTDRDITLLASSTLDASGVDGATINYRGTIDATTPASTLVLVGSGAGEISGNILQSGTATDVSVNSGSWTLSGTGNAFSDDIFVNGETAVLNLAAAGVLNYGTSGSNGLYTRGGTINLLADDVTGVGASGGIDFIMTDSGVSTFNTNTFRITTPRLEVGSIALGNEGHYIGTGTLDVQYTGTNYSQGIRAFRGSISANLAGTASFLKQGLGEVVLSGDNSGLTGTVATRLDQGSLVLDFTNDNNVKLNPNVALDIRGVTMTVIGSSTADTVQSFASTTLGNGGASKLIVQSGAGHSATVVLGNIGRSNSSSDGTMRFVLPENGAITSTTNNGNAGVLGGSAYATVDDGTGTYFAVNDGSVTDLDGEFVSGNIVALKYAGAKNDVTSWTTGDHVTDDGAGFVGQLAAANIGTLRFNAAPGGNISLNAGGVLGLTSGGVLITDQVLGSTGILGGTLYASTTEVIVTHDAAAQTFTISSWMRMNLGLTKAGAGTIVLTGTNNYEQETELQAGTLIAVGGNAIGDTSLVNLADDQATLFQILDDETIGRLNGGNAAVGTEIGIVDLRSHTLTINQTANSTFAGTFHGTGTVVKQGPGNLALTGNGQSEFTGNVVVNQGVLYLAGANGRLTGVSSFTLNHGAFMIDNNDNSAPNDRIADTAAFTLNSADGTFLNEFRPRGLTLRTDDNNSNESETIGVVTLASGASYATLETAGTRNAAVAGIVAADWVRSTGATINVRGELLGEASGPRSQFKILNGDAEVAFLASSNLVGGGGDAGTSVRSIVPWAIGETFDGNLTDAHMGNSLVTYVDNIGLVPLRFADEYRTFAAKSSDDDNIRESLTGDLVGLGGQIVNALVLHDAVAAAATVQVLGTGVGQSLLNTSGAFLFTVNPDADASSQHNLIIDGFDAGLLVGGDEYVFHVVNPNADAAAGAQLSATIRSALGSAAHLTKSGRGALILTGVNAAGGGAYATSINEGILEIADLDNIGGDAGTLLFAGGTLRLAAGYSGDDLSTRAITFMPGGGTLDDQGRSLSFAGTLGTGLGGFTKLGSGLLTLNSAADYLGSTTIGGGSVILNVDHAIGRGDLTIADGATLELGARTIDVGLVTLQGVTAGINGTGVINSSAGFVVESSAYLTAQLNGSGGLMKTTDTEAYIFGVNSFTGPVEIRGGRVFFDSIAPVGGGPSALGAPTSGEAGVIRMGLGSADTELVYYFSGIGHTTDRVIGLQGGSSGDVTISAEGGGSLVLGGATGLAAGTKTLTLQGSTFYNNGIGAILNGAAAINLIKAQSTTWELLGSNDYSGSTSINQGTLRLLATQDMSGALNWGNNNSVTTGGVLELAGVDASFGSMIVQINSASEIAQAVITPDNTLTINGNVRIGSTAGASLTQFSASGGGAYRVENANNNGEFEVGSNTSAGNRTIADFTGLSSFTVLLSAVNGTFRVNPESGTNRDGAFSTLYLPTQGAADTMIRANNFAVGSAGQNNASMGQVNSVYLGAGVNTLHVNAINIGTGSRDVGYVGFLGGGSIVVRAADGVSAAAFNMGTGSSTTGISAELGNTFDVMWHDADLLFAAVEIGTQDRNSTLNNYFGFNQGSLVMESLTMSTKGTRGNTTTSTMDLGGGTVSIGTGSGAAVTLATNAGPGTALATINITGADVTVAGDIVKGANTGVGNSTGTVNLNGAASVLDMSGFSIGGAAAAIDFVAQAGTLRNLAEFNGGATLVKSGLAFDMLTLDTANGYTGATQIDGGTLRVAHGDALGATSAGTTVAQFAALELAGGIAVGNEALVLDGDGIFGAGALRNVVGDNSYAGAVTLTSAVRINSDAGTLSLTGGISGSGTPLSFGGAGNVVVAGPSLNLGASAAVVKDGGGALSLNTASDHGGTTTVASGTFNGSGSLTDSHLVLQSGATLSAGFDVDGANNNGVGTMGLASAEWQDDSRFVFDFSGVASDSTTAGTDWDLLLIGGALTLDASADYIVEVSSWTTPDGIYGANSGLAAFDPNAPQDGEAPGGSLDPVAYSWLWVDAGSIGGGLSDGRIDNFIVDASGVFGAGAGYDGFGASGSFWVSKLGGDLYMNYGAVPEPGSLCLIGVAGLGLAAYRRRKKRLDRDCGESRPTTLERSDGKLIDA